MANTSVPAVFKGLTEQQRKFVVSYVKLGEGQAAVRAAGYSESVEAHYLLRDDAVVAAVHWEIRRLMASEGAQIGFAGLKRIARDTKAPAAAQVAAAKALLQGAGLLEAPQASGNAKSINDMTRDELREYIEAKRQEIDQVERQLADAAQDVTPNPDTQALDIFE